MGQKGNLLHEFTLNFARSNLRKNYEEVLYYYEDFYKNRNRLNELINIKEKDENNFYSATEQYLTAKKIFEYKKELFEGKYKKDFFSILFKH